MVNHCPFSTLVAHCHTEARISRIFVMNHTFVCRYTRIHQRRSLQMVTEPKQHYMGLVSAMSSEQEHRRMVSQNISIMQAYYSPRPSLNTPIPLVSARRVVEYVLEARNVPAVRDKMIKGSAASLAVRWRVFKPNWLLPFITSELTFTACAITPYILDEFRGKHYLRAATNILR